LKKGKAFSDGGQNLLQRREIEKSGVFKSGTNVGAGQYILASTNCTRY